MEPDQFWRTLHDVRSLGRVQVEMSHSGCGKTYVLFCGAGLLRLAGVSHFTRGTRIEMERSKAEFCGARIRAAWPKSGASHPQNLLTVVGIAAHPVKPPRVGHPVHDNLVGKMVG
jgi:hypothetical protein